MSAPAEVYESLAVLLQYPRAGYKSAIDACLTIVARHSTDAAVKLAAFDRETSELCIDDFEELFTGTFDLNPVAALEIGWQLYGEQYERGRFLARMRELLVAAGVEENGELPDHLVSSLLLLGRIDPSEADAMVSRFIAPALERIAKPLDAAANPYRFVISATNLLLRSVHSIDPSLAVTAEPVFSSSQTDSPASANPY